MSLNCGRYGLFFHEKPIFLSKEMPINIFFIPLCDLCPINLYHTGRDSLGDIVCKGFYVHINQNFFDKISNSDKHE